jgi:PIN domain nuclease of toxin-antitoxin system
VSYLVDSHYLIWSLLDPSKLEQQKKKILLDPSIVKYVSKITYWEVSLKYSLGKLELKKITPEELLSASLEAGYELLEISVEDLITSYKLPRMRSHKDPFDRLLIWQCVRNALTLITADRRIKEYEKYGLKLA